MIGMQIVGQQKKWIWIQTSLGLALLALMCGIWKGPLSVYGFAGFGIVVLGFGTFSKIRKVNQHPSWGLHGGLLFTHILLLGLALTFQTLFLNPLPDHALTLPKIGEQYPLVRGQIEIKGPQGWLYESIPSAEGIGIRIQPQGKDQYMGVSEIQVWVRELKTIPPHSEEFLREMAMAFSPRIRSDKRKKLFQVKIEETQSLQGNTILFSTLDMKRLWVPLRQVTLLGIKNERYLCTVSATGLKNHSTLSKVLCIGLFETIQFHLQINKDSSYN